MDYFCDKDKVLSVTAKCHKAIFQPRLLGINQHSMGSILVFSPQQSPRLDYILDTCLRQIGGLHWQQTADRDAFLQAQGLRINASSEPLAGLPWLPSGFLLLECDTPSYGSPEVRWFEGLPTAFEHDLPADLPFFLWDWLFYLISRYEEYGFFTPDAHGRFSAAQSLAQRANFLHLPVVDLWVQRLFLVIQKYYPTFQQPHRDYRITPTFDIDYAYSFLGKGFVRQTGAFLRHLFRADFSTLRQQVAVWLRLQRDPYDTFDFLEEWQARTGAQPIFFWLVGNYGEYDKNCSFYYKPFQQLVKTIAQRCEIGWHPSYQSNSALAIARLERDRLSDLLQKPILRSRQHFLRLNFPETYRRLIQLGIREEHSMGYADATGFRASTSTPFYWFDLDKNEATDLRIVPFVWMDVTLHTYLKLSPEEAYSDIHRLREQIRAVGGEVTYIWHNNSLSEQGSWKGWRGLL